MKVRKEKVDTFVRDTSSIRGIHNWTAEPFNDGLYKGTALSFSANGKHHKVFLKGCNIIKRNDAVKITTARLGREKGNNFFLLVKQNFHGVTRKAQRKGGYMYYHIKQDKTPDKWVVSSEYYSKKVIDKVGIKATFPIHEVFWRVHAHLYYRATIQEVVTDGNTRQTAQHERRSWWRTLLRYF